MSKLKYAVIFFLCWTALLVLLVDGILGFQTLVDYFGSYIFAEITLLLFLILPTVAVYIFTKEPKAESEKNRQKTGGPQL